MKTSSDALIIGGVELHSRLFIGTGKYGSDSLIPAVAEASGAEVITVALRRVDLGNSKDNVLSHIPGTMRLLPNTSGARTADEAVRIARLSRAAGCGDWIKIEVISDTRHLLPDGYETAKATEILAKEGFTVLPYMNPDLYVARDLVNAGAAAVMPLGAQHLDALAVQLELGFIGQGAHMGGGHTRGNDKIFRDGGQVLNRQNMDVDGLLGVQRTGQTNGKFFAFHKVTLLV